MQDVLELATKSVAITGAASGIGRAAATALAAYGASLHLMDANESGVASLAEELRATGADVTSAAVDVSDPVQVRAAFETIDERWERLDILIHVAGIMRESGADVRDVSLESWSTVLGVNLTGSFLVAQEAAKRLIPVGAGTIILVGSGAGVIGPSGSVPYGSSKAGVNGLAMTLEHYLTPHGIRVHNFCPGAVDTPLYRKSLEEKVVNGASADSVAPVLAAAVDSEGVGRALALLASPLAGSLRGNIYTR